MIRRSDRLQLRLFPAARVEYLGTSRLELAPLRQIEQVIKDTEIQLRLVQTQLDASRKQAAAYKRENQPVPDVLRMDIETLEKSNQDLEVAIIQKRAEEKELRVRFEEDKKRYIELTQRAPAPAKPAAAK
mgnify:CR=1 FL=1